MLRERDGLFVDEMLGLCLSCQSSIPGNLLDSAAERTAFGRHDNGGSQTSPSVVFEPTLWQKEVTSRPNFSSLPLAASSSSVVNVTCQI
jgi:hypothetical protein